MHLKSNAFANFIFQIIYVAGIAVVAARVIPITLFSETSYVSVVASALIVLFLVSVALLISVYIPYKDSQNYDLLKNFLGTSAILYLTSSGIAVAIFILAQSGTPFPPGALLGDMGNYILFALEYQETGILNYSYPPGISWLLVFFSQTFDASLVAVSKPVYIFFGVITAPLLLHIYSRFLPKHIAGTLLLLTQFSIFYSWREAALHLTVAILLLIVWEILNSELSLSLQQFFRQLLIGFALGAVQLLYFGYIYWLIPAIVILLILSTFQKNRYAQLSSIFNFHLGFALALSGMISYKFNLEVVSIIGLIFTFIIFKFYVIWAKNSAILRYLSLLGLSTIIPWLYILLSTTISDSYIYEGALETPGLEILPNNIFSVVLIFIIFVSLCFFRIYDMQIKLISVLAMFILSSALLGLYFASRMQITNLVELWPRYKSIAMTLVTLLIALIILLIIDKVVQDEVNALQLKNFSNILLFTFLLLFTYIIGNSSKNYTSQLPAEENFSAMSYASCSNLVENKKLSGYLIERPEWGKQIIEACKELLGDSYVIAPSYQWGFYPIEIENNKKFWSWVYLDVATLFVVNQNSRKESLQISFQLTKVSCLDQVNVQIKYQGETLQEVNLTNNDSVEILVNIDSDRYTPATIELWSDQAPCKVVGDDRELIIQITNLQDNNNPLSRYEYFS